MDRTMKLKGVKFSRAFSDFTCLVYANVAELSGSRYQGDSEYQSVFSKRVSKDEQQKTIISFKSNSYISQILQKVTFAGSSDLDSSFGLPKIDEDLDQEKGSPRDTQNDFYKQKGDEIEITRIQTGA